MVQVRVAGALSGAVIVDDLATSTVASLRAEVARLLGLATPDGVKLILGGRTLQPDDGGKTLHECGVTAASRVLVVAGAQAGTQLQQQEAKVQRLEKVKRVLAKMSSRHAARHDDYSFEIVNQDGRPMQLQEQDRKALGMGMALHDMGKAAMAKGDYEEALQLLSMAEESFGVADAGLLKMVDNVGMALLDVVWCCYKSGDIQRLAVARDRLQRSRQALLQAYGPDLQRLRQLHGTRCPEHAIFTRLEALEAVAAYHCGDLDRCRAALAAAQGHWAKLQVSDVKLAQLQDMGYTLAEAKRALRMSGGDLEQAIVHIGKDRALKEAMREKRQRDARWREERRQYGRLPSGDYVDGELVDRLENLGYSRELSALALRLLGNNLDGALELLLGERPNAMLVQLLSILQGVRQEAEAQRAQQGGGAASSSSAAARRPPPPAKLRPDRLLTAAAATELSNAFSDLLKGGGATAAPAAGAASSSSSAAAAVAAAAVGSVPSDEEVLVRLHSTVLALAAAPRPKRKAAARAAAAAAAVPGGGGARGAQPGSSGSEEGGGSKRRATPGAESDDSWVVVGGGAAAAAGTAGDAALAAQLDAEMAADAADAAMSEDEEGEEGEEEEEGRESDAEMEGEVRASLQSDAMASYDLDVAEEGDLIATYSALVASTTGASAQR